MKKLTAFIIFILLFVTGHSQSKGVMLGNSTVVGYDGTNSIAYYLLTECNLREGNTCKMMAEAGNRIEGQQAWWMYDGQRDTYDWITVEIGLNDTYTSDDAITIISKLQTLINTINATKKPTAKVLIFTMTPCHQWYINYSGAEIGEINFQKWQILNAAIMGMGQNAITGVDARVGTHTALIMDSNGNLLPQYDTGDHIHENNAARQIIANEYRKALKSLGFLRCTIQTGMEK